MRQSEVTGLDPANDNQTPPSGQGDLFLDEEIEALPVLTLDPEPTHD